MVVRYDILNKNDYFNSVFGEHYITTGMNLYSMTNKNIESGRSDWYGIILENNTRDNIVKEWNVVAKNQPTLLKFLTKNIHK